MTKTKIQWKPFLVCIAIPMIIGGLSSLVTKNQMKEFNLLNQPEFSPPGWLFPVVWTTLYLLMGISSYLVFTSKCRYKEIALALYAGSLAFNFLWPIVFFNFQSFVVAFLVLVIIVALVALTIAFYSKCNKIAALLQIPYLLWLLFAGYLNIAIYFLNR